MQASLPGRRRARGAGRVYIVDTAALEAGLVTNPVTPTALRLAPPITVSEAEIDEAMVLLASVLGEAAS